MIDLHQTGFPARKNGFEKILKEEEEHIDWLEVRCGQIEEMGLPNYLAHQIED